MITEHDLPRLKLPNLTPVQSKRLTSAENACRNATTDWAKNYWFEVFRKLCTLYGATEYFRRTIH
jgi:hypothetical protein